MTAPPIIPSRPGTHRLPCPCGAKGKRDTALAVTVEADGSAVWFCHRCGAKGCTGHGHIAGRGRPETPTAPSADTKSRTERARRWIAASQPIKGTIAETFLNGRGIDVPDTTPLRLPNSWSNASPAPMPRLRGKACRPTPRASTPGSSTLHRHCILKIGMHSGRHRVRLVSF